MMLFLDKATIRAGIIRFVTLRHEPFIYFLFIVVQNKLHTHIYVFLILTSHFQFPSTSESKAFMSLPVKLNVTDKSGTLRAAIPTADLTNLCTGIRIRGTYFIQALCSRLDVPDNQAVFCSVLLSPFQRLLFLLLPKNSLPSVS